MPVTRRIEQQRKGLKPRQLMCNLAKHDTKESAKEAIDAIRNKGIRGSARLIVFKCKTCSRPSKEIYHIGHRRREIN